MIYNGYRVIIEDGKFLPWQFAEYVEALCRGEQPSFMHKFVPGPKDGEVLMGLGVMILNSKTFRALQDHVNAPQAASPDPEAPLGPDPQGD